MFGELLKQARLKAEMTQEDLAARAALTREYVSLLERDKRNPTIEVFIRLVRAVGLFVREHQALIALHPVIVAIGSASAALGIEPQPYKASKIS